MPEYIQQSLNKFKKGPQGYRGAKGADGSGNFGNLGQKPATRKRVAMVDKKIRKAAGRMMLRFKKGRVPPASQSPTETRSSNNA